MAALNPNLIGQDIAINQMNSALASGRMHHAWLIAGIEGIGKSTLAYHIAANLLSGGENIIGKLNLQHRVTKLIVAESHPDLLVIKRSVDEKTGEPRKGIVVEDVLKISAFLHKTSTHGGWRVVIIDEAHLLNRHGQNAVLKILEEPPPRTLIMMTTTTLGALLPTIRSRCRVLPLSPLDPAALKEVLTRNNPGLSEHECDKLLEIAGGSIGFALKLIRTEILTLFEEVETMLQEGGDLDIVRLHKIAEKISSKSETESYEALTALLLDRVARSVLATAEFGGSELLIKRLNAWDQLRHLLVQTETANLDRKLAFIDAVSGIHHAEAIKNS